MLAAFFLCVFPQVAVCASRTEKEIAVGRKASQEIEKQFELLSDPVRLVRLSTVMDRLVGGLDVPYPWQVKIVRLDEPNAFCLPGGFIYFTAGMLELLNSDSEIAAVMAHEISHVLERHGMKQAARNSKLTLASLAVIAATGGAAAGVLLSQVAQIAVMSSYSIDYEKEADKKGLEMMMDAGYSPAGMVTVMEMFMAEDLKKPIYNYGIFMNHPESRERVRYLSEILKQKRVPLHRKEALLLLRTSIESKDGLISLLIDGREVWRGPDNKRTRELIDKADKVIDAQLQMELAPYDLAVEKNGGKNGEKILRLRNSVVASEPLPKGMQPLETLRANLIASVQDAVKKHPIAQYFR